MKSFQLILIFLLLTFVRLTPIYGQAEYFVQINPTVGTFEIVNDLPNINQITVFPNYTTFDKNNKRFIFKGRDESGIYNLYTVNALSGLIESSAPYPAFSGLDNLIEFQYDNSTNTLYGLKYDTDTDSEFFCSIDIATGVWKIINPIPIQDPAITSPNGLQVHFSTFDENQSLYIIRALDNAGNSRLYRFVAATGGVISLPLFPVLSDPQDQIHELQYDNASETLYGMLYDNSADVYSLVSINPDSGVHTVISEIAGLQNLDTTKGYTYFDEINHRYVLRGMMADVWQLISLDAATGSIVSNPPFPQLGNVTDNLMELQFDNDSGALYGLHYSSVPLAISQKKDERGGISVHPNPASDKATITLDKWYAEVDYKIYTVSGQLLQNGKSLKTASINLDCQPMKSGIYVIIVTTDSYQTTPIKLIVE